MPSIHLVERLGYVRCIDKDSGLWDSGYWAVSEDTAKKLVGGHIYLHKAQDRPSHFGGRIEAFSVVADPEKEAGRIVFRFQAELDHKGVVTGRDGWGNEKKIEW